MKKVMKHRIAYTNKDMTYMANAYFQSEKEAQIVANALKRVGYDAWRLYLIGTDAQGNSYWDIEEEYSNNK